MVTDLTLEVLGSVDGDKVNQIFNTLLKRASDDCYDRPNEPKDRAVTMTVYLRPVCDEAGELIEIKQRTTFKPNSPDYKTRENSTAISKRSNRLSINPHSLNNVYQATFLDDDDEVNPRQEQRA
jgi:hypothetical protein